MSASGTLAYCGLGDSCTCRYMALPHTFSAASLTSSLACCIRALSKGRIPDLSLQALRINVLAPRATTFSGLWSRILIQEQTKDCILSAVCTFQPHVQAARWSASAPSRPSLNLPASPAYAPDCWLHCLQAASSTMDQEIGREASQHALS